MLPLGALDTLNSRFFSWPFWVFLLASWHSMHFACITFPIYMWAFKACFTVNLQPKCSWCEFLPDLVTLALFGHFRQKELLLIKFTHPFNPIRSLGGGGGLRCLDDQLTFAIQKLPILRMMPKCCDFPCLSLRHVLTKF